MASLNDSQVRPARKGVVYSRADRSSAENDSTRATRGENKSAPSAGKPRTSQLKKSLEPFLQHAPCFELVPILAQCMECRMTRDKEDQKVANVCRFMEFRKLRYDDDGAVSSCGFLQPTDATEEELKLFLPSLDRLTGDLDVTAAVFILSQVGDHFCAIVKKEREGQFLHLGDKAVAWKHLLEGVREMCDVCETTIFNIHWVCRECGFAVCIDCYRARRDGTAAVEDRRRKARDEFQWLPCTADRQPHRQDKLMMTQIIPGTALWDVCQQLHRTRLQWNIASHCGCDVRSRHSRKPPALGPCKQLMRAVYATLPLGKEYSAAKEEARRARERWAQSDLNPDGVEGKRYGVYRGSSLLSSLAAVAPHDSNQMRDRGAHFDDGTDEDMGDDFDAMRGLVSCPPGSVALKPTDMKQTINKYVRQLAPSGHGFPDVRRGRRDPPARVCTLTESSLLYPNVCHTWLCNGKLLVLHEPRHEDNLALFQEQWRRGQPVVVADVCKKLNMLMWHPGSFRRDFGDVCTDLVNCRTGAILLNQPMHRFWEGFENFRRRMIDEDGEYMLLKLKDWPPGADFSEILPRRFDDLMKGLPLPEYTLRDGVFNLAARLPDSFARPDLGPKMYIAYGSALYPKKGTTNLHLDVSDAVNVMVYVGIPKDGKDEEHVNEALKAIDEGSCDTLTRKRIREKGAKPGALWHIFHACDADKIRDLLNKVAVEQGERPDLHDDPIHDQRWYLDEDLRDRLYREYGVEGYAIVQCLGDAVFIPAGAPHQVRNLHSCIKVAEDFVSPENIAHCLSLTDEFRQLSDTHTNHEDKLQIKNVIYHAAKDALVIIGANSALNPDDKK